MKKKTIKDPNIKNYRIYGTGMRDKLLGLEKIIDDGTNIGTIPEDFYLKNGKLNPKYKSTYSLLKNK